MSHIEVREQILKMAGITESQLQRAGSITVPTKFPPAKAQTLSEREFDTTPAWMNARPKILSQGIQRARVSMNLGLRAFFEKPCIKLIDPKIDYSISPVHVIDVKYYFFYGYIDGFIENKISNRGTEGRRGTKTIFRWEDCPTSNDEYEWEVIKGSADLAAQWAHELKEKTTDTLLGNFSQSADPVIGQTISRSSYWKTGDLWDLIVQVFNILLTGTVTTTNGYDVTVSYDWNGTTQTRTKHIDKSVRIPVKGDLTVVWGAPGTDPGPDIPYEEKPIQGPQR